MVGLAPMPATRKAYCAPLVATIGTILSAFFIGSAVYFLFQLFHTNIGYINCLLFGALISPTDPISVLSILTKANLAKSIEVKITAESLFNDGIGVVLFATLFETATHGTDNFKLADVVILFLGRL